MAYDISIYLINYKIHRYYKLWKSKQNILFLAFEHGSYNMTYADFIIMKYFIYISNTLECIM